MKISGIPPIFLRILEQALAAVAFLLLFTLPDDASPSWGAGMVLTKCGALVAAAGAAAAGRALPPDEDESENEEYDDYDY